MFPMFFFSPPHLWTHHWQSTLDLLHKFFEKGVDDFLHIENIHKYIYFSPLLAKIVLFTNHDIDI